MTEKEWRNYQILNTIATGGTAVLYKAIQTSLDRPVVVKRLHSHLTSDPNFTRRFALEAKAAASLDHENIVRIIDFGSSANNYYIVMEYIDGLSLKELQEKHGVLGEELSLLVAREICLGLDHAHQRGIIHRDIKPANIMITSEGLVKITDFGLAKLHQSQTQQTIANTLLGTPLYMSPEQAIGEGIDGRSDLFSLGTICYETTTGTQPFMGENYAAVIQNIINGTIPPPSKIGKEISPGVEAIVMKALNREPTKRFRTALEMARSIESHFGHDTVMGARDRLRLLVGGNADVKCTHKRDRSTRTKGKRKLLPIAVTVAAVLGITIFFSLQPGRLAEMRTKVSALFNPDPATPETTPSDGTVDNMVEAGMTMTPLDPFVTPPGIDAPDSAGVSSTVIDSLGESPVEARQSDTDSTGTVDMHTDSLAAPPGGVSGADRQAPPQESTVSDEEPTESEEPPKPAKGFLEIHCQPSAEILIDGKTQTVGERFGPIEIQAGHHEIVCRKTDYKDYRETVVITRGELSRRRIILQELMGRLHFDTQPGASIYIDGTFKGTTPLGQAIILPIGLHRVELRKAGFNSWKSEVFIPADELLNLRINLVPN
ncbi:MAG: serine/threonine protein kinase [bacterium]|nr:MAG: serine/threonine protein kinase [bacterium]